MKDTKTILFRVSAVIVMVIAIVSSTRPGSASQDPTYRLMNLERRVDQFQTRLDMVERAQQNQAMNARSSATDAATATVLELQRMNLSLGEQVVFLQKQMLEMQKQIDRLSLPEKKTEAKEPLKEDAKPKPRAARP